MLLMLAFCLCCFVLSGCTVTTYSSGYDYNYAPPADLEARRFRETGKEQPYWHYRPLYY